MQFSGCYKDPSFSCSNTDSVAHIQLYEINLMDAPSLIEVSRPIGIVIDVASLLQKTQQSMLFRRSQPAFIGGDVAQ